MMITPTKTLPAISDLPGSTQLSENSTEAFPATLDNSLQSLRPALPGDSGFESLAGPEVLSNPQDIQGLETVSPAFIEGSIGFGQTQSPVEPKLEYRASTASAADLARGRTQVETGFTPAHIVSHAQPVQTGPHTQSAQNMAPVQVAQTASRVQPARGSNQQAADSSAPAPATQLQGTTRNLGPYLQAPDIRQELQHQAPTPTPTASTLSVQAARETAGLFDSRLQIGAESGIGPGLPTRPTNQFAVEFLPVSGSALPSSGGKILPQPASSPAAATPNYVVQKIAGPETTRFETISQHATLNRAAEQSTLISAAPTMEASQAPTAAGDTFINPAPQAMVAPTAAKPQLPLSLSLYTRAGDAGWNTELRQALETVRHSGLDRADIKLHPEELGSLEVRIKTDESGTSVTFASQVRATRELLEAELPRLREHFEDAGIELTESSVDEQLAQQQHQHPTDLYAETERDDSVTEKAANTPLTANRVSTTPGTGRVDQYI